MAEDLYSRIIANPVARNLLLPFSCVYGGIGYARVKAYAGGLIERVKADAPVISVGNLSVGGTGKTPVTIDITKRLIEDGNKVAILSRGYKRKSIAAYTVVSNGDKIVASCDQSGDEPYMMAQALPGAVVISGRERSSTSRIATAEFHCDVIVLDDGFQHLKLRRDFDVVLLDYSETLDDALVPAGRLREPPGALGRASHIVISKLPPYPDSERMLRFQNLILQYAGQAQVSMCRFKPACIKGDREFGASQLSGKRAVALCGIARPASFVDSIKQLGAEVVSLYSFPDHHWFSENENDWRGLNDTVERLNADYIVTTEKDLVRMHVPSDLRSKLVALAIETEWIGPPPQFNLPSRLYKKRAAQQPERI